MAGEGHPTVGALALVRGRLDEVAAKARPVALAREHVLPVVEALQPLLPEGLRRGSVVTVDARCTSLALALLAGPSAAGSWAAVAGVSSLGLVAAAGYGVALERLVVVAPPEPAAWGTVVATLVDAFDVVMVRPGRQRARATDARRLAARARERGTVLVALAGTGTWPEAPDHHLQLVAARWEGLGDGYGHLQARRVTVEATGRRGAARSRLAELWLPGPGGGAEPVTPLAGVRPLRAETGRAG